MRWSWKLFVADQDLDMDQTDEQESIDQAPDTAPSADDDQTKAPSDAQMEGEPEERDIKMEETVQNISGSSVGPVANLKEAEVDLQGTPKGRLHTLVLSLPCFCPTGCAILPCMVVHLKEAERHLQVMLKG